MIFFFKFSLQQDVGDQKHAGKLRRSNSNQSETFEAEGEKFTFCIQIWLILFIAKTTAKADIDEKWELNCINPKGKYMLSPQ